MRVATRSRNARSCVTTIAAGTLSNARFEQLDAVDIEMVRRLVEQQQIGFERERQRERRALALAARGERGRCVGIDAEAMQILDEPRFGAPALALVVDVLDAAAREQALA